MSKIAIKGATTGTGVFTLESPATNTDRTLILPDEAGTVLTSASPVVYPKGVPAFRVTNSANQDMSSAVDTKVVLDSKDFDYGGYFDSTTNYRYTPLVAGLYQFNSSVTLDSTSTATRYALMFVKNGVSRRYGDITGPGTGAYNVISGSALLYMNGATDYIEMYATITGSGTLQVVSNTIYATELSGFLVRAD